MRGDNMSMVEGCKECPYNDEIYDEELDAYICDGFLNYGYCFYAEHEE